MTKIVSIPPRDRSEIEAEARAWIVRLDGDARAKSEVREFQEWIARSPLHREAFERALGTWNELDHLSRYLDSSPPDRVPPPRARPMLRTGRVCALLGAMLAIVLTVWLAYPHLSAQQRYQADFATPIGEVRTVSLPDGTELQLNTGARVSVAMDHTARLARLDSGEVWFHVSHDPDLPFVVYAAQFAVKAVGTAFSVRVDGNSVDMIVTDGRVEVATMKSPVPRTEELQYQNIDEAVSRVPLEKGQHVVFDDGIEFVRRMAPNEIERNLSWRDGVLIFDNEPLRDVVVRLNAYSRQKIVISDPKIENLRFGGYFRIDDVASILATFEEDFGIRVERVNDNTVYLSRRHGDG